MKPLDHNWKWNTYFVKWQKITIASNLLITWSDLDTELSHAHHRAAFLAFLPEYDFLITIIVACSALLQSVFLYKPWLQQPPQGIHHAPMNLERKSSYLPPASLGFALVRGDDGDPSELVLLLLLLLLLRRHFASSEQRQGSSLGVVCNMNQGDPGYRARRGLEGSIQVKLLREFRRWWSAG